MEPPESPSFLEWVWGQRNLMNPSLQAGVTQCIILQGLDSFLYLEPPRPQFWAREQLVHATILSPGRSRS